MAESWKRSSLPQILEVTHYWTSGNSCSFLLFFKLLYMCVCVFWGGGVTLLDICNLSSPTRVILVQPEIKLQTHAPLPEKRVLTTGPWGSPSLSYKCNMFVIKRKIIVKKSNIKCGDRVKPESPLFYPLSSLLPGLSLPLSHPRQHLIG